MPTDPFVAALDHDRVRALLARAGLPPGYPVDLAAHVAPLAAALARLVRERGTPPLIGLNGCQGSGKSTMVQFLSLMLDIGARLRCAVLSIDDFYLGRRDRLRLAADAHPLLATRGVPGTHDLPLAHATLDALLDPARSAMVRVPRFDKATDDRLGEGQWQDVEPGVHLVVLEGWCVGCPPQPAAALAAPVNELERSEDKDGGWRRYVNHRLETDYREFFARLDRLVLLQAPGFDSVLDWRRTQEQALAASLRRGTSPPPPRARLLDEGSLRRFVDHFERLTRHQLRTLPAAADGVIKLGADHRMTAHGGRLFR